MVELNVGDSVGNKSILLNAILKAEALQVERFALNERMSLGELVVILIGGLLLVAAGVRFAGKVFSEDSRRERRRRRSNAPISAKANRPMVKFSVKTKKQRRK